MVVESFEIWPHFIVEIVKELECNLYTNYSQQNCQSMDQWTVRDNQ